MKKKRQIIAMGGGGFSMEPDNLLLDQYVLKQTGKKRPKVCFVPTASADSAEYTLRFYKAFSTLSCEPSHLPLFSPPTADLRSYVLEKDVIYVGGGNTKNLLALWKEWKLDEIFREAWHQGIVLAGISAGSLCWFEQGITDSIPGDLTPISCLGFLKGSNCPHYDGEKNRRPTYQRLIGEKKIHGGMAADDGVALHYIGTMLNKIVSSRPDAKAYQVEFHGRKIIETSIDPEYLGSKR
jgi:peptidase E